MTPRNGNALSWVRRAQIAGLGWVLVAALVALPAIVTRDRADASMPMPAQPVAAASVDMAASGFAASIFERRGSHYYLWLNRYETRAVGYSTWGGSWIAGKLPAPYSWILKGYLWLMKRKAKDYYSQGKCMLISWKKYWFWANPLPVFVSYKGGYCR